MNDPLKWCAQGHVTYFLNFWIPSLTFERVKLDTSFFLCWIGHGEYYPTGDEWPLRGRGQWMTPKGSGQSHVTYFLNFKIFCCNKTANIIVLYTSKTAKIIKGDIT